MGSGSKKKGGDDDDSKNPDASIMNLMKDMYNSGDDNIKRTIAESWEKARMDQLTGKKL